MTPKQHLHRFYDSSLECCSATAIPSFSIKTRQCIAQGRSSPRLNWDEILTPSEFSLGIRAHLRLTATMGRSVLILLIS